MIRLAQIEVYIQMSASISRNFGLSCLYNCFYGLLWSFHHSSHAMDTREITKIQVEIDGAATGEVVDQNEIENQDVVDVIPVQIVDDESFQALKNLENSHHGKTKYYKQTYRPAWEQMPDFAGWLRGVEGEPTRAFCCFCKKTLHAHRLSLLKHTCTIRHQKAAQSHYIRKTKTLKSSKEEDNLSEENISRGEAGEVSQEEEFIELSEHAVDVDNIDENINELPPEQLEDDEESTTLQFTHQTFTESLQKNDVLTPISTQVTDSVRGIPVAGLQVSLYQLIHGRWTYINEGFTSHNGRCSKFLDIGNAISGRYKLHYDVDRYFESKNQESLYPFIEIVFDFKAGNGNYHIPLILSPNGYTTYKG